MDINSISQYAASIYPLQEESASVNPKDSPQEVIVDCAAAHY